MTMAQSGIWGRAAGRFYRSAPAMTGLVLLTMLVLAAIIGWLTAADQYNVQTNDVRLAPSAKYWFGTDDLGRDMLQRVLYGAHLTLGTGLSIVVLAALGGVPLGIISAYAGGLIDEVFMRIMDIILAFPSILLALALVAALGFNLTNIILAISLVYIPRFARVARASAMVEVSLDYVRAAESLGCGPIRLLCRHVLPNCLGPAVVLFTLSLGTAILEAAGLSFLGLGAQPPLPEWGRMISDGRSLFQTHPHVMIFPGLAIGLSVLALNLVGDGLRDALDARMGA